ncbi:hypothetical protein PYCCODRAFT_1433868 [Trametes coccinea BRFM310]|uniref:BTB domain-containing protein n=1 Tax=Trametes coccinea (strain BRFM310) TaxID=1353009 RepID=A0A1Y2IS98_TRAC3|nr:hypothetical protein PYCCODRAFT_1433868 [Trametes coccinea BRFM310]
MDHGREDAESSTPRHTATKKGKKEKKRLKRSNREQGDTPDELEPVLPVASTSREDVLRAALLASASGRFFEDVKFHAFSRRGRDGSVTTPLPVLANTSLLRKASSYFDYLFANAGFAESALVDIDAPYPSERPKVSTDYDYDSDSDLEEDGDDEDDAVVDFRAQSNSEDTTDTSGECSGREPKQAVGHELDDQGRACNGNGAQDASPSSEVRPSRRRGRVVFLDGVAHKTWKAFVLYAYLGDVSFAPLRSEGKASPPVVGIQQTPPCSPKSLYRLAERYDVESLKALCRQEIMKRLHPHNILQEVFSTFSSLYPAIQDLELEYLQHHINEQVIKDTLPVWIAALARGQLPASSERVISALILSRLPVAVKPNTKSCPNGCTTSTYYCQSCGMTF